MCPQRCLQPKETPLRAEHLCRAADIKYAFVAISGKVFTSQAAALFIVTEQLRHGCPTDVFIDHNDFAGGADKLGKLVRIGWLVTKTSPSTWLRARSRR